MTSLDRTQAKDHLRWRDAHGHFGLLFKSLFLLVLVAITLSPFVIMLSVSFGKNIRFITFPLRLIPSPATLDNYLLLFGSTMVPRWLLNSLFITTVGTVSATITSSLAGYAFARGEFVGKTLLFILFLGILMVPMTIRIVPLYIVLSRLRMLNTYAALIGPWAGSAFGTFLLRQQYQTIPTDYDDAARIDGASDFQICYRVLLPQLKPALATLAALRFMDHWNDFLYPMVVTSRAHMRTLTVGLGTVFKMGGDVGLDMAGAVIGFVPTLIIYLSCQRYVTRGATLSGLKM